jgi:hypothetical protein
MVNFLPANYRTRVLLAPQANGSAIETYAAPSAGVGAINVRAIVAMGNSADVVLSLKSSDDASGTNAAAWASNVVIYKDGVKQTDAKALTIGDSTGNFIVDFCVDPATVPAGKFVGLHAASSSASNLLTTVLIEDVMYKPTATA